MAADEDLTASDAQELRAWSLLKEGKVDEAEALWDQLLAERLDDPELLLTAGVAHRDAGHPERAADLLTRSLEVALSGSLDPELLREAATERTVALDALGRGADALDGHVREALDRIERQAEGDPIAAPWYPAGEYAAALEQLPGFAADWSALSHEEYSVELDRRLRDVVGVHGHTPLIVPIRVADQLAFAEAAGLDPEWAETRARMADARRDEALNWPPGRNEACWCGADAKYKRHCGT